MTRPLRVCLDARVNPGKSGGLEQFVIGMAAGLSSLCDGDEEYHFLVDRESSSWLTPFLGGRCRLLETRRPESQNLKRSIASIRSVRLVWDWVSPALGDVTVTVPVSDGTIERAQIDVMHMTLQLGFITDIPSIYHPHDLQYLHLPRYFSRRQRLASRVYQRTLSNRAKLVAVSSTWCKQDVVHQYGISDEKVKVVPLAPASSAYAVPTALEIRDTQTRFSLPPAFAFYPAQTWPHKNHTALLKSLAWLRDRRGLRIPFVSSGFKNSFFPSIEKVIHDLKLESQVRFLGFVSPLELKCLYASCRCVLVPTKFEAASFPLWEAFLAGAPAACSNVTSLPQQAGDAALIFDPDNVEEMADAIERLWTDESLRTNLVALARAKVAQFSWKATATTFRAYYRQLGNRNMTPEDHSILAARTSLI
ncbi:glycosyltransferase family 4 protein [Occallatibacter savannae]|uniref:glycosyltransferase family 4 protein n=1 Tax=Occallatibacter savannae TaxID=1002691 RepID=UPI000D694CAA|nr:glycosyltransferase family 1 protein [Occallatibacter savannae]